MPAIKQPVQSFENVWTDLDAFEDTIYCQQSEFKSTHVPVHSHKKGQLLYTEGGRVYITAQNKVWFLPARHYMWIPAGVEHSLNITLSSANVWNIYYPFWPNEPRFYKQIGIYPVNNMLLEQLYFTKDMQGHVRPDNISWFYFLSGIKSILPEISRGTLLIDLPQPKDQRLVEVINFIQANLSQPVNVCAVAKRFGMSESTLTRVFRKDLKMSFINYVSTLRLLRSVELLAAGEMNIKEVCYEVGYESVPTFSNVFKRSFGVRPTEYLKAG
jgi:AraC-like DNA-binding protein